jgi:hypothetical protein
VTKGRVHELKNKLIEIIQRKKSLKKLTKAEVHVDDIKTFNEKKENETKMFGVIMAGDSPNLAKDKYF